MTADVTAPLTIVDTLCNAFTPDRLAVWDGALAATGTSVKVRRNPDDSFADPEEFVARMTGFEPIFPNEEGHDGLIEDEIVGLDDIDPTRTDGGHEQDACRARCAGLRRNAP